MRPMTDKFYKLRLSVELIEVESFEPPQNPFDRKPADPVERDREEVTGMGMLANLAGQYLKPPPAPPQSELQFRRTYDVPAPSLEAAAALLKKFEETAETLGTPAAHFDKPQFYPSFFPGSAR